MEPLFVDPKESQPKYLLKKIAQEAQMPPNEAEWPSAILGELYKQAPYIEGMYSPEVVFAEKDSETGFSLGTIVLTSGTSMAQPDAMGARGQESAIRTVQIPFIIRAFRLAPLDLIVGSNGKFLPQTRQRVRDSLFKPTYTDGTSKGPQWNQWLDSLTRYPMSSASQLISDGMHSQILPFGKGASARSPLLQSLAPLDHDRYSRLERELDDPLCKHAATTRPPFLGVLERLSMLRPRALQKEAELKDLLPPNVIQVIRKPGAVYHVKYANSEAYDPVEEDLDRGQALQSLGEKTVQSADESGMVTVSTSPVARTDLIEERIEPIKSFGVYRVKVQGEGRELLGWVFPRVVDLDGMEIPMSVFNNGSENAIQPVIAGIRAGSAPSIPGVQAPQGSGVFYRTTGDDGLCLVPLSVGAASQEPDGSKTYQVSTIMGKKAILKAIPGSKSIEPIPGEEDTYVIPGDMQFMPLPSAATIELVEDADSFSKMAHLRRDTLTIRYTPEDQRFTLDGCGIDKLATKDRLRIRPEDALFLGASVGIHPELMIVKLARARDRGIVTVLNLRPIKTAREVMARHMSKVASSGALDMLARIPAPQWLVKEAAILGDTESADHMLSLGFINPHNIAVFLGYTPDLERTQEKICEILYGARLGGGVDLEQAAMRAMRGIENTLSSLKLIGMEANSEEVA